ncbi:zinc ribbon domain-containing protein [Mitsuokella multacida]|uniref:zinc ribbon domain-containing protein n=1 Tax=Mitsuokella multacida TaxID=52226 RepID=UPI0024333653|nr:zinc ribbon domain-containing protein [Mitsuokella multacida]
MKTQMAAAKQSVSGLSDKLTEHEHIQQTGSKISGLSDKMALLNHEAIISPQVFDWVQEEIKRRREGRSRYSGVSIFSSKIKCAQCGSWYGAKVWHSTDKYRRTIYRCNKKYDGHKCQTPHG